MTARGRRALAARVGVAIALASSGAPAAPKPAPADVTVLDMAPLIWSVKGPAKTPWEHCLVMLAGRPHGDPAPQLSTLCASDGRLAVTTLAAVHRESRMFAVEAGPDGGMRVLVGRPGGIDEIRFDSPAAPARTVALIDAEELDPSWLGDRPDLDGDGRDDLLQATYDGISLWRREPEGGMTRVPGPRLPPAARLDGEWLTVRGQYVVAPVPPAPVRWTWPETLEGGRLRTYRAPLAPAASAACAAWIDTQAKVYASKAVFLSDEPARAVLLVAPADKVAVFGNLSLLVAPLACDETARGHAPSLRVTTDFDSNFGWTALDVTDVTGDDKRDIVIVGRQGLVDEKFKVAVYPGRSDGSFALTPLAGVRSDLDPLASSSKNDVDGDGRADLVVLDRTRVLLARARATRGAADLPFDLRNATLVALPESMKSRYLLDPVDFDGDGRLEAVVSGEEPEAAKEKKKKKPGDAQATPDKVARVDKDTRLAIVRFPAESR